jgi:hypothetical protein
MCWSLIAYAEPSRIAERSVRRKAMRARLALGFTALLLIATSALPNHAATTQQHPILIPGVLEPKELQVEPLPINKIDLTAPERMLGEALKSSDASKPATLLPSLNQILAQYPDSTDGYVMRAFAFCDAGSDRNAITTDLNRAINSINGSRTGKASFASLLATRAKIEYLSGDYATAINDLEQALRSEEGIRIFKQRRREA